MNLYSVLEHEITLDQAISLLLDSKLRILFFQNEGSRIIASFTEGDALRAIMRGMDLQSPAIESVRMSPTVASSDIGAADLRKMFLSSRHFAIPLVSPNGTLDRVATYDEFI